MKQRGKTHYNIVEFICEYANDISSLPTDVYADSTAYIIEDGNFYILNHNKKWLRKKSQEESNLEQKVKNLEQINSNLISENIMLKEESENSRFQFASPLKWLTVVIWNLHPHRIFLTKNPFFLTKL